jgi:hypothetical protein
MRYLTSMGNLIGPVTVHIPRRALVQELELQVCNVRCLTGLPEQADNIGHGEILVALQIGSQKLLGTRPSALMMMTRFVPGMATEDVGLAFVALAPVTAVRSFFMAMIETKILLLGG